MRSDEGFMAKYRRTRAECPEEDCEKIEEIIADLDALIENSIDNPEVLQRYDETKGAAAVAEVELKDLEDAAENQEGHLAEKSESWTRSVTAIAVKLNKSFGKYMEDLQYQGEVQLRETGGFANWEMQMKVKFREERGLVDLPRSRHRGGERAVSTVMYLMALQDLTSAPFRVVDEINQGMDERNERLVFDRIVQSCCGSKVYIDI
jgi:chromosome segregation ATPase